MRNYCKTIGALAAASALAAGNASAVDLDYSLHAGYTSEYIFRGTNLGADLIEAGFGAAADWNGLGLSAGAWYGSFDNIGDTRGSSSDELDLTAGVSKDLGFLTAEVGYIYYYNFDSDITADAQEVYFGVSRSFYGFDASLRYYWDIELDNDGYSELAISKSFELTGCLALNVGSTLGYLVEEGHLAHLTTKVALDYTFAENAKLSPFASASLDLSGGHGNAYTSAKNELVGGAIISVSL